MAMKFLRMKHAPAAVAARKPGYLDACLSRGKLVDRNGEPFLQLSDSDYEAIRREFSIEGTIVSPRRKGLGDAIHKVAGPIGRAVRWPCLKGDGTTELKPGSPCDRARNALNRITAP